MKCDISRLCSARISPRVLIGSLTPILRVLFVGEAAGRSESVIGEPFVGASGELLEEIAREALPAETTTAFVINAVQCVPYVDGSLSEIRAPEPDEIKNCSEHVLNFVEIIEPHVIFAVGAVAEQSLKQLDLPYTRILHPAAILRSQFKEIEIRRAVMKIKHTLERQGL